MIFQVYSNFALDHPSKCKLIALAEPRPHRRTAISQVHSIDSSNVFTDWRDLAARGRIADAVIVAVLDGMHVEVVKVFAELGYGILCEKVNPPQGV